MAIIRVGRRNKTKTRLGKRADAVLVRKGVLQPQPERARTVSDAEILVPEPESVPTLSDADVRIDVLMTEPEYPSDPTEDTT